MSPFDELEGDIAAWVELEADDSDGVPAGWDDLSVSERLAAYLADLGYRKDGP